MTQRGLWIDDAVSRILRPEYWDEFRDMGYDTAALMLDTMQRGWDPRIREVELQYVVEMILARDRQAAYTVWPEPSKDQIDDMVRDLDYWCKFGVVEVEVDVEHLWKQKYLRGFRTMSAAADYLVKRLDDLKYAHDVRIALTTHTGHAEAQPGALLTPLVDRVYAQLYSCRKDWRGTAIDFDDRRMGPGHRQRRGIAQFQQIPGVSTGEVGLCIGQALFSQKWPGHDYADALDTALAAALECDPPEIRDWSSKVLLGPKPNAGVRSWVLRV